MARATMGSRDPVCRALAILEALAREGGELGVTEIGQLVHLHKSTAYRLLQSLVAAGFVAPGKIEGTYRASIKLSELGNLVLERIDLRAEARDELKRLSDETGETVHLVVFDDYHGVYVDKVESRQTIRMYSRVGRRIPLYCTAVGKVLLAATPKDNRRETLQRALDAYNKRRFTSNSIVDLDSLEREIERVSANGYALDREEHEPGVVCVAAPIRNHLGEVVAACSVSAPLFRVDYSLIEGLITKVIATGNRISGKLGYVGCDRVFVQSTPVGSGNPAQLPCDSAVVGQPG